MVNRFGLRSSLCLQLNSILILNLLVGLHLCNHCQFHLHFYFTATVIVFIFNSWHWCFDGATISMEKLVLFSWVRIQTFNLMGLVPHPQPQPRLNFIVSQAPLALLCLYYWVISLRNPIQLLHFTLLTLQLLTFNSQEYSGFYRR